MTAFFSKIFDWLTALVSPAIALLPDSPFNTIINSSGFNSFTAIMHNINYFVPIGTMISILSSYTTAILIYYAVRLVLRWAKFIQ